MITAALVAIGKKNATQNKRGTVQEAMGLQENSDKCCKLN